MKVNKLITRTALLLALNLFFQPLFPVLLNDLVRSLKAFCITAPLHQTLDQAIFFREFLTYLNYLYPEAVLASTTSIDAQRITSRLVLHLIARQALGTRYSYNQVATEAYPIIGIFAGKEERFCKMERLLLLLSFSAEFCYPDGVVDQFLDVQHGIAAGGHTKEYIIVQLLNSLGEQPLLSQDSLGRQKELIARVPAIIARTTLA